MVLSRTRSDRRDRRFCRFGVMLVVCSLLVNMVCVPKAKAVAVVDDVAIGAAATAAYFTSTGIPLTVTAGGASAASAGIVAVAGEYAAATGAAASGEALLGSIAAGTALTAAGAVVLTAAAAAAVGALAYWLYSSHLVDSQGSVIEGSIPIYQDSSSMFLLSDGTTFEMGYHGHPGTSFQFGVTYSTQAGSSWRVDIDRSNKKAYITCTAVGGTSYSGYNGFKYGWNSLGNSYQLSNRVDGSVVDYLCFYSGNVVFDANYGSDNNYKGVPAAGIIPLSNADSDILTSGLSIQSSDYSPIPEIAPAKQLELDIAAPPELELADVPEFAFEKVAAGDWSQPSTVPYSVTTVDPGPDPSPDPKPEPSPDPDPEPEPSPDPDPEPEPSPDPDPDAPELPSNLGDLGAALTTRFPFSIPWDIARAIKLIAAPAQAPYWEVDFLAPMAHWVGGFSGSTKVVLDFGKPEYEIIGIASRWTSTIGFCLALAAATKRFIWTA